jgi:hypothetical protein
VSMLSSPRDLGVDAYATTDDQCTNYNKCRNMATRVEHGVPVCGSCTAREAGGYVTVSQT